MLEGDMPTIEWHHICLDIACGAMFIALLQEATCRVCGGIRLIKRPIIRKLSGGCIPKSDTENPFVEQFDPDDD